MDRRSFFKIVLATPLLTPLLLASKTTISDLELFLIGDEPNLFLAPLLKELEKYSAAHGRNVSFLNSHLQDQALKQILSRDGWKLVQKQERADLTLAFSHLQQKVLPSFTLIRDGKIWDIRSMKLRTIWEEMNKGRKPSSFLTIASFRKRKANPLAGEYVYIYKDGHKIETLSLKKKAKKSFNTKDGKISVHVENGKAWISESSCLHKICLNTPPAAFSGERIICAPNHFLLDVKGSSAVDTVIG